MSNGEENTDRAEIESLITEYLEGVHNEFVARWEVWPMAIHAPGPSEVTLGLTRRQYSLAAHVAMNPYTWTPDFTPIVLRCMVEVHVWLGWILEDPEERSRKFIDDGIGREKLIIKHRTDEIELAGGDPNDDPLVQLSEDWVESQRYAFLVDVNLSGSWSGQDTRTMAEEAGLRDFYRFAYPVFSTAVHSTWNHVGKVDLMPCSNPLHAHHRIPRFTFPSPRFEFLVAAARFLDETFGLVDRKLGISVPVQSTYHTMFQTDEGSSDEDDK